MGANMAMESLPGHNSLIGCNDISKGHRNLRGATAEAPLLSFSFFLYMIWAFITGLRRTF